MAGFQSLFVYMDEITVSAGATNCCADESTLQFEPKLGEPTQNVPSDLTPPTAMTPGVKLPPTVVERFAGLSIMGVFGGGGPAALPDAATTTTSRAYVVASAE